MKLNDKKQAFIQARADGTGYATIEKQLGISHATCSKWNKALKNEIDELKEKNLNNSQDEYLKTCSKRRAELFKTFEKICDEESKRDYTEIGDQKLLELKLKYLDAIKEEYIPNQNIDITDISLDSITHALIDLGDRVRQGKVQRVQAELERSVINDMVTLYDKSVTQAKMLELETTLMDLKEHMR